MSDKFIVRGLDAEGNHQPDADCVTYMLFCPAIQDWLPGSYEARHVAETVRGVYERLIDYYAVVEFAHVKLYRLDGREHQTWGGHGRVAPIASFTSVEEFERFTKKPIKEFNGL